MSDIRQWLKKLGIGEYAEAFEAEKIDLPDLPYVTEDDLKEMGLPIGPLRRVLAAIKGLQPDESSEPSVEPASTPPDGPARAPPEAERRQITVMFCDLVGSTALSEKLDPEDLREVMAAYQKAAGAVIERYEGHVAQYLGDGLMTYFGWPMAHEDDAERAVRASLEVVDSIATLDAAEPLAVRIGVATGLVVVGGTGAGDASVPKLAVGETPNLAARLQGLAEPNAIVISPVTRELVADRFSCRDLGSHELKGIGERVRASVVLGLHDEEGDDGGEGHPSPPILVGRDAEIGLLHRAWQQSKEGLGQVVLVNGEPGIGKTALVETLAAKAREEGSPRIIFRCSAFHTNSAMYPVISHVKRLMGWQATDSPEIHQDKLERMLDGYDLSKEEVVPLFAAFLSVSIPAERYPQLSLGPEDLKQQILDSLVAWTLDEAERRPTLMICEDLHWADPSTLEYLGMLLDQAPTSSLLLILTFRPDFEPPWRARSHMTPITLSRLERPQIEFMVKRLTQGKDLPSEVTEYVVRKTDGVPLFVEELTKTLMASKVLRETADRYELSGPLSSVAIPATLQDSLMARLDRVPKVREVAQLGAVLGREFGYEMLHALGYIKEPILQEGLGQLVADELLYQRGRPPRAKYVFKHALVRDAAYYSLLKRTRQQYHRHVAQVLEEEFSEEVASEPELLAYHYTGAKMALQAIEHWLKAAKRAASRSAYLEALAHLDSADTLLEGLPEGDERTHRRLQLQSLRATTLLATKGMSAEETGKAFASAWELCKRLGEEVEEIFPVLWGVFTFRNVRAEYHLSHEVAEDALQRAERLQEPALLVLAHRMAGPPLVQSGQLISARDHLEEMRRLYDPERDRDSALVYGVDFKAGGQAFLAQVALLLGNPDRALTLAEDAVSHAEKLEHFYSVIYAQIWVALIRFLRREPKASLDQARVAMTLAEKKGFGQWLAYAKAHCGRALIDLGQAEDGVALIDEALREGKAMGIGFNDSFNLASLAVGAAETGDFDEAEKHFAEALTEVEKSNERWYEAEIHRLQGELALDENGPMAAVAAEKCFGRSLDVARRQQAKSWELRAATSLARLWQSQDKTEDAHALLAPVYDWFTEGFDTADLKDAKALLDELK